MAKIVPDNGKKASPEQLPMMARQLFSYIIALFLAVTFVVFPLFYHNYYFDLLITKYRFYFISVLLLALVCLAAAFVFWFIDRMEYTGDYSLQFLRGLSWKNLKKKLTLPEIFLLVFLLIAIISTLQSGFLYESFWGNEGRYSGLFLMLLYGLSVFLISRLGLMKQWYLDLFLFTGLLVCLFGITDYFRMDLLHWKVEVASRQVDMFTSTLGNINTYTAFVGMVVGVSAALFATGKNLFRNGWYYIVFMVSLLALITGQSDNAYLSLGALFCFLPFALFGTRRGIKRYVVLIASFFAAIKVIDWINKVYAGKVIGLTGIFDALAKHDKLELMVAGVWLLVVVLYLGDYFLFRGKADQVGKWLRITWFVLLAAAFLSVFYILYDANFGGHPEKYQAYSQYLIFNDSWGTDRGYCWRIGWEAYMKQPLIHKLFGFGPDTFGLLTWGSREETIRLYGVYYESAHNEYLQLLVTMGPFALISYLGFLGSSWYLMGKKLTEKPWLLAPMIATVCYAAQAFVNISIPIATPLMWTLIAVGLAACHGQGERKSQ